MALCNCHAEQDCACPPLDVPIRRQAAFEALLPSFGDDGVVFHSPTDYQFDPEMIKALESVAKDDPDPVLRERAANTLKQIDLERAVSEDSQEA